MYIILILLFLVMYRLQVQVKVKFNKCELIVYYAKIKFFSSII